MLSARENLALEFDVSSDYKIAFTGRSNGDDLDSLFSVAKQIAKMEIEKADNSSKILSAQQIQVIEKSVYGGIDKDLQRRKNIIIERYKDALKCGLCDFDATKHKIREEINRQYQSGAQSSITAHELRK